MAAGWSNAVAARCWLMARLHLRAPRPLKPRLAHRLKRLKALERQTRRIPYSKHSWICRLGSAAIAWPGF